MGTKRFEVIYDCWTHGTGITAECRDCGHWVAYNMLTWPKALRSNLTYDAAARRMRCSECGSKRIAVNPGRAPGLWKGNR
jgi:Zn finger protein HypA/HybF involved in hydrogenase expression